MSRNENDDSETFIIGAYSPDSWCWGSEGQEIKGGDDTCFLFNLTENLRFNARPDKEYYTVSGENEMRFGTTDLVISGDFNNVSSSITRLDTTKKKQLDITNVSQDIND